MTTLLQHRHDAKDAEPAARGPAAPDLQALLHNLQLHQAELEMQNDELRRAQAELAQAHDRFQDLYDFAPVGYLTFDAKGTILEVNLTATRMLGVTRQNLLGRKLPHFIARDSQDGFHLHRQRVFADGASGDCELTLRGADGTSLVVQMQSVAFINPLTQARQCRAALIDLAERKRAEAALREMAARLEERVTERTAELTRANERLRAEMAERRRAEAGEREKDERLRALMASSPVAIVTFDRRGIIESVNPACCKMFGYSATEITGRDARELMPPLRGRAGANTGFGAEARGRRRDGTSFPISVLVSEFSVGGQRRFAGFLSDTTPHKQLEREILEIREREQERIGHDLHDGLGQHLHGVSYFCSLLQAKLKEKSRSEAAEAGRIVQLLADAVKLSHDVAAGLQPVQPGPRGLMIALRHLAGQIRSVYAVDCRFHCPKDLSLADHAAATHLYRIVQEATHNAVQHGRPSRIRISLAPRGAQILLRVADNGVGLPRRLRVSRRMGLQIMLSRADALGGSLLVKPARGGGTEILLTLPDTLAQHPSA